MYDYDENIFVGSLLVKAMSPPMKHDVFLKVKQVLLDSNVIIEYDDGTFDPGKKKITLKDVVKIEQIMDEEIIKFPTEKEWLIINRKRKLEQLNNISNG